MEKYDTIEDFKKALRSFNSSTNALTVMLFISIFVLFSAVYLTGDISKWHWIGRLMWILTSLFCWLVLLLLKWYIIGKTKIENSHLFQKEESKTPLNNTVKKSKFQQRLEDMAKQKGYKFPKEDKESSNKSEE